jgi:hypothetical protein
MFVAFFSYRLSFHMKKAVNCMMFLQLRSVGSNMVFAAATEISDSVLKGAETNGFDGMVSNVFSLLILFLHSATSPC